MNYFLTLKNVYTCRLARLISPVGSTSSPGLFPYPFFKGKALGTRLQWDLYESIVNDFFASYLIEIDFVVRRFENH